MKITKCMVMAGIFILCFSCQVLAQKTRVATVSEETLRKVAKKTVMPIYPNESVKKREAGVVVVELEHDLVGDVVNVAVLESPSPLISKSATTAVSQWKFPPATLGSSPIHLKGKLTFYYAIDKKGKGVVSNPPTELKK